MSVTPTALKAVRMRGSAFAPRPFPEAGLMITQTL
jgi:hypothetical protein